MIRTADFGSGNKKASSYTREADFYTLFSYTLELEVEVELDIA